MSKGEIKSVFGGPDSVTLKGRWNVKLHRGDQLIAEREGDNVITSVGKEFLASFLQSAAAAASTFTVRYVGVGTDATAEAVGNTALGTELTRVSGVVSYVSNAIYQVTATFASGVGTGSIVEYGLFSSSTGGTMLSRDTEGSISKGANDTLTTIVRITVG